MVMADSQIARAIQDSEIKISPVPHADQIQPASLDVRLGHSFITFEEYAGQTINPVEGVLAEGKVEHQHGGLFNLSPGQFVLAQTFESIGLANDIVARVEGCSSLGRLGLMVHVTAGFIDPGWPLAPITLELHNVSPYNIILTPEMKIAQLSFDRMELEATRPYGSSSLNSHYANQNGVTASRYGKD